jgi:hypothetical protein
LRVESSGFRVENLRFVRFRIQGVRVRVYGLGCKLKDFRVWGLGLRVEG